MPSSHAPFREELPKEAEWEEAADIPCLSQEKNSPKGGASWRISSKFLHGTKKRGQTQDGFPAQQRSVSGESDPALISIEHEFCILLDSFRSSISFTTYKGIFI
jgi:hypothetical protein